MPAFETELRGAVRGEVALDPTTLALYSTDASSYRIRPVAVCLPRDETDVCAAVRIAARHGVSVLPRGGGTSLAGQCVGASLVLDFSKHMTGILEINAAERWVRVQPGVVRDELNAALKPHGLHFAPDPATGNRANIGGMIGNNASGTRSIVYGKTVDHVLETRNVLTNGEVVAFRELSPAEYADRSRGDTREALIHREFARIIREQRDEIEARFPKVMRRASGYNLDEFTRAERWNLSKLVTGSEGTLATLLEARLNLTPLPACRLLCVAHFTGLLEAIRAVEKINALGPSAVELVDRTILGLARGNLATAPLCDFLAGDPAAVLLIEFFGENTRDLAAHDAALTSLLKTDAHCYAHPVFTDVAAQERVWSVRKSGLGLMQGMRSDRKPTPFIEDACVPVAVLAEYIERVLALCGKRGIDVTLYAHASVGLIHVRPLLDLRLREDIEHMKAIADEVFAWVKAYGGSWSGEHGDGLVRGAYIERFFGARIYGAFRAVKQLFDPDGIMNPGKIIDVQPMDENLRYGAAYREAPPQTYFKYRAERGFGAAVRMCTGVGTCRKSGGGTMCPSYMATREERHSTRGRANALRLAISGDLGAGGLAAPGLREVFDLCLSCKACKAECASNVDVAKLKAEFLQAFHDAHGTPLRDRLVAGSAGLARRIAGPLAPLANSLQRARWFRRLLEAVAGLDRRRVLPAYAREPFPRWFARRGAARPAAEAGARHVVLFDDTFLNYYEPGVGLAAVELLESCGYVVHLARAGCCQRPRISRGLLREAARDGLRTLRGLDVYIRKGWPVVVCEPSCATALTDDLPDLIDDEALAERIAGGVLMIDVFLERERRAGRIPGGFVGLAPRVVLHGHCHQKALYGTAAMKGVLAAAPDVRVRELDSGCCGLAGAFGYETEHYDLSQKIGEDRLFPALRSADAEETVVACGFSCRQQIREATGRRAVHWVETVRGVRSGPS